MRWHTRIVINLVKPTEPLVGRHVLGVKGKGRHIAPLRRQEFRGNLHARVATLVDELRQLQRLPTIRKEHVGIAWLGHHQVPIHRIVISILIPDLLVAAVLQPEGNHLFRKVVAQCAGIILQVAGGVVGALIGQIQPQLRRPSLHTRHDHPSLWRFGKTVQHQPRDRLADGRFPCRRSFLFTPWHRQFLGLKWTGVPTHRPTQEKWLRGAHGIGGERGVGVEHQHRGVPKVPRMNRGPRPVVPNPMQQGFVPQPRCTVGFR